MTSGLDRFVENLERRVDRLQLPTATPSGAFAGTILDAMDVAGMRGPSWAPWRAFWKAVYALPMEPAELALYRAQTGRETAPAAVVREAWLVVSRRAGKSRNAALGALYGGIRTDYRLVLAPGEPAVIPVIAADRDQAGVVLGYLKGLCRLPAFEPYVDRELADSIELRTGVTIDVKTASYRTTRGFTVVGLVADELAFWRSEESANPDREILNALRPGMLTVPGALLLALSSPYAARGELHRMHERHYGKDGAGVLVWAAASRVMNPTLPQDEIDRAFEEDPAAAAAEYGGAFRRDVEALFTPDAIDAVTIEARLELPPCDQLTYVAFADPGGGSGKDSMTLAIAHLEDGRGVLDCMRERRPPFSPDDVVQEFVQTLRSYHVHELEGDRYAAAWVPEAFARHGISYNGAKRVKSDLYRNFVAAVNAARVELLDLPKLRTQLVTLERRTARGGKDSIDHPKGGHDDVANAAAGALVHALDRARVITDIELPVLRRQSYY